MGQSRPLKPLADRKPVFFLLAGPNGAGKSTLYKAQVLAGTIPASAEFVNADLYEAQQLQDISNSAVALCKGDWTQQLVTPLPVWAQQVLGSSLET